MLLGASLCLGQHLLQCVARNLHVNPSQWNLLVASCLGLLAAAKRARKHALRQTNLHVACRAGSLFALQQLPRNSARTLDLNSEHQLVNEKCHKAATPLVRPADNQYRGVSVRGDSFRSDILEMVRRIALGTRSQPEQSLERGVHPSYASLSVQ